MKLVLYETDHCALCNEAANLVYACTKNTAHRLQRVDITEAEELMEKYQLRIPVISISGQMHNELDWPFTQAAVKELLAAMALNID